jgi:hypothetical protein
MPYIVSTHTSDVKYVNWKNSPAGGPNVSEKLSSGKDHVLIKGKHGVVQKNDTRGLFTQHGIVTKVTDEEMEFLLRDQTFQQHLKSGAVKRFDKKIDGEEVAPDMSTSPDAPLTQKDYLPGGRLEIPKEMRVGGGAALQ